MNSEELFSQARAHEDLARELRTQGVKLRQEELLATPLEERLVYAATARCHCKAGMAYDPAGGDFWDCSAILLGTASANVKHEARLPFAFWEVKSEKQPSAYGATTRPQKEAA